MLSITVQHGESQTLYYVVREGETETDWEVIKTFHSKQDAEDYINNVEQQAHNSILTWCRSDKAKRHGNPCMRIFDKGSPVHDLVGHTHVVTNVNATLRNPFDGTLNDKAIVAAGDSWQEALEQLGQKLSKS